MATTPNDVVDFDALHAKQLRTAHSLAQQAGISDQVLSSCGTAYLHLLAIRHRESLGPDDDDTESDRELFRHSQANWDRFKADALPTVHESALQSISLAFAALDLLFRRSPNDSASEKVESHVAIALLLGSATACMFGAAAPHMIMRELGRRGAQGKMMRDSDGKQAAKAFVRQCWNEWQSAPQQYKSVAAFARSMLAKFPDTLVSQPVVEGWARSWKAIGTSSVPAR